MKSALLLAISLALAAFDVRAANEVPELKEGVQSFQQSKDAWRRSEQENQPVFLPGIADSIGAAAAINIEQAEQVFCYEVDARAVDYDGYTIDGMALTGFCGVLNPELKKLVLQELFMSPQNVIWIRTRIALSSLKSCCVLFAGLTTRMFCCLRRAIRIRFFTAARFGRLMPNRQQKLLTP